MVYVLFSCDVYCTYVPNIVFSYQKNVSIWVCCLTLFEAVWPLRAGGCCTIPGLISHICTALNSGHCARQARGCLGRYWPVYRHSLWQPFGFLVLVAPCTLQSLMQLEHWKCRVSCEFQQMKLYSNYSNTLIMQVIVVCSVWLGKKPRNDCIRIYVYNYVYNYALLVQCSGCPCKLLAAIYIW